MQSIIRISERFAKFPELTNILLFIVCLCVSAGYAETDPYNKKAKDEMEQTRKMLEYNAKGGPVADEYRKTHPNGPQRPHIDKNNKYSVDLPEAGLQIVLAGTEPVKRKTYELPAYFQKTEYPYDGAMASTDGNIPYGDIYLQQIHFYTYESCLESEKMGKMVIENDDDDGAIEACSTAEFNHHKKRYLNRHKGKKEVADRFFTKCRYGTPSGMFIAESITFSGDIRINVVTVSEMGCELMQKELKKVLPLIQFKKLDVETRLSN